MMHFTQAEQEAIAETGFFTSLLSYVLFWTLDVFRPGFVARFFSVHVFLVGLIVFGVWWGAVVEEYTDRPRLQHAVLVLCGLCVGVLTWNLSSAFGSWRIIMSALAFLIPLLFFRLLKYK